MTKRLLILMICAVLGLTLLLVGWLVPAHLRAVDASVIQQAGRGTPGLVEQGLGQVNRQNLGTAQLLLQVAQSERLRGTEKLAGAISNLARQYPDWTVWGGGDSRAVRLFESDPSLPESGWESFTAFAVREQNRLLLLQYLAGSSQPAVQELLRSRTLTNTVILSPSQSASGQAFDAAVAGTGYLIDGGYLSRKLTDNLLRVTAAANRGGDTRPMEQALMDFLSLGQRLNWNQLVTFVGRIDDVATLHALTGDTRQAGGQLPALFAVVTLSGQPAVVAHYLGQFDTNGLPDLTASLPAGTGGVDELLHSDRRLFVSPLRQAVAAYNPFGAFADVAAGFTLRQPVPALALKWLLFLAGGFMLALAMHFARPPVTLLERPLQVRGFHYFRELLFALGFLLVAILLSEPFLAQENQKEAFSFQLHVPTEGSVVTTGFTQAHPTLMNHIVLLTLLLFFVLQGLLYVACLVKLAEIHRQKVPPRVKLRLLENEEHLFDAGLYLGFVGTIVSLILVSMGLVKFSLMAAYSSTSFGICFVVIFKIFHLRPARRKLVLETEAEAIEVHVPAPTPPTSA